MVLIRQAPVAERNERLRERLVEIRAMCRTLLAADKPLRDNAIFHCGSKDFLSAFRVFLAAKNPAFQNARPLEELAAGRYLAGLKDELLERGLPADYDENKEFRIPGGATFGASFNGLWRDLSARFAQECSGVVNAIVSPDRAQLHRQGLELWATGRRHPGFLRSLRVFGFVEFPILAGALARNVGVTEVNIYTGSAAGQFQLLEHVVAARTAMT